MLVLTRKRGEAIYIGDNIEIRVLHVNGSRARLGLDCPRETPILRSELDKDPDRRSSPCQHRAHRPPQPPAGDQALDAV